MDNSEENDSYIRSKVSTADFNWEKHCNPHDMYNKPIQLAKQFIKLTVKKKKERKKEQKYSIQNIYTVIQLTLRVSSLSSIIKQMAKSAFLTTAS